MISDRGCHNNVNKTDTRIEPCGTPYTRTIAAAAAAVVVAVEEEEEEFVLVLVLVLFTVGFVVPVEDALF